MINLRLVIAVLIFLLPCACMKPGGAYPEEDGRVYLEKQGYPASLVDAVVAGTPLEPEQVEAFSRSSSADVRYLVARNRYLSPQQIDLFIGHRNDFTRSGAANNPNLTDRQVSELSEDRSHTVRAVLAGNPTLSDAQLLTLYAERNLVLLWFARNPNCPPSIRDAILRSDDPTAKQLLEDVDSQKRNGVFVRGSNGRWMRRNT